MKWKIKNPLNQDWLTFEVRNYGTVEIETRYKVMDVEHIGRSEVTLEIARHVWNYWVDRGWTRV